MPDPDRLPAERSSGAHDLHGQGDLLHAAGRGRQRRPPGGLLPLRRLQPLDRARGGSRDRRSARSATPTSSAPTARTAASSRPPTSSPTRWPRRWPSLERPRPAASSSAPAASRCCSSTRPLIDALHAAASRSRSRPTARSSRRRASTGSASAPRPAPRRSCSAGNELKLVYPQAGAPTRARSQTLDFEHFFLQPMDGPELEREHAARRSSTASRTRSGGSACRPTRSLGIR